MKRELAVTRHKLVKATDLVNSSCSCPGSGGKNLTASLNRVFAGPEKPQQKNPKHELTIRPGQTLHSGATSELSFRLAYFGLAWR